MTKKSNNTRIIVNKKKHFQITDDNFNIHGLYWYPKSHNFHRLNDKIFIDNQIDLLQKHSSGGYLSFQSDSTSIGLKVTLASAAYMHHMSAIGQIGLDLYVKEKNKYIFIASTKINEDNYELTLINDFPKKLRQYRLYFPTYIELKHLEIILDQEASIQKAESVLDRKLVCYGTSITQGACASRPGMSYSSILGRYVDYEVINLGFSGNANLHYEIAKLITQIQGIEILIMEVEANAGSKGVLKERLEDFVKEIVSNLPNIKIFLISNYPNPLALFDPNLSNRINTNREFQKNLCNKYHQMKFIDGERVMKSLNFDETVDGIHLTDLGFYMIAKEMIKEINKISFDIEN